MCMTHAYLAPMLLSGLCFQFKAGCFLNLIFFILCFHWPPNIFLPPPILPQFKKNYYTFCKNGYYIVIIHYTFCENDYEGRVFLLWLLQEVFKSNDQNHNNVSNKREKTSLFSYYSEILYVQLNTGQSHLLIKL